MAKHIQLIKFLGKRVNINGSPVAYKPVMMNLLAQQPTEQQAERIEQHIDTAKSGVSNKDKQLVYTNMDDLPVRFKRRELTAVEMDCINVRSLHSLLSTNIQAWWCLVTDNY